MMPLTILIFYLIVAMIVVGYFYLSLLRRRDEDVERVKSDYQNSLEKEESARQELKTIEAQSQQIFTLYDMTRAITKNFSEGDAFRIFEMNLRKNVSYQECHLLEPRTKQIDEYKNKGEYFLFTLMGQKELLGYLAIKGMSQYEEDHFMILAHQFALALRRIRLYQSIERLSVVDTLTDVHTRRYILEQFEEELKRTTVRKGNLSFLMLDVDFFKTFNDRYGHLVGDQILREIAKIVRDNIREIDVVGRFGGEEFCAVLPDTDRVGAQYVAERIRSAVEKSQMKAYDTVVRVTISIGVTTFPEDGQTVADLLENADQALYRAKKSGRNRVCPFNTSDKSNIHNNTHKRP